MTEENKTDVNAKNLDALLRKYLSVWLWSILFGGATTLTFSLVNIRDYEKWGMLTSVTSMLLAISIVFLVIAWMALFQFLKTYLIGTVFVGRDEEDDSKKREKSGRYLSMSFYALIMAGILRLMIELTKQIFQLF
jgi:glucan phosphoethanolaminetransferase (alkaline phosphatase superfamily)